MRHWLAWSLLLVRLAAADTAHAHDAHTADRERPQPRAAAEGDDARPHETSGPALLIGVGELYSGVGAQLGYQQSLADARLHITPHVGGGYAFGADRLPRAFGLRGGVTVGYGRAWRWIADVAYGALTGHELRLHGIGAATRAVEGASLGLGLEAIDAFGVVAHALIGPYLLTARGVGDDSRWGLALGFGIGWKPW